MANQLDEMNAAVLSEGRSVDVIATQLPVTVTAQERMLPQLLMTAGAVAAIAGWWLESWLIVGAGAVLAGYTWWALRQASAELSMLEQRIQTAAAEIDNYMEQRVVVLDNLARLLDRSVQLDKELLLEVTKYRSGVITDENRNAVGGGLRELSRQLQIAVENYPELKAQDAIRDAMRQNLYLQQEITAARSLYNDTVNTWNREIFRSRSKKSWRRKRARRRGFPLSHRVK